MEIIHFNMLEYTKVKIVHSFLFSTVKSKMSNGLTTVKNLSSYLDSSQPQLLCTILMERVIQSSERDLEIPSEFAHSVIVL